MVLWVAPELLTSSKNYCRIHLPLCASKKDLASVKVRDQCILVVETRTNDSGRQHPRFEVIKWTVVSP